jgi:hypothetical protein
LAPNEWQERADHVWAALIDTRGRILLKNAATQNPPPELGTQFSARPNFQNPFAK